MFIVLLLVHSIFGWSKEIRTLTFESHAISSCGGEVTWKQLMPTLSSKEQDCLDSIVPLVLQADESKNSIVIERMQLVESLKRGRSECLDGSEIKVPESLVVKPQKFLNGTVFRSWIVGAVGAAYLGKEIEIGKIQIPNIECNKVKSLRWGSLKIESKNTFRFLLLVDEKNFGLTGDFRVFQNVPVPLRNLAAQEKMDKVSFDMQKRDVTFNSGIIAKLEDLEGRILSSPVAQGEPIPIRALKVETTIEKGQIIQAQFRGENFELSSNAVAEQSGSVGELIKIKNVDSQKILSGIVIGKGLVEVQ